MARFSLFRCLSNVSSIKHFVTNTTPVIYRDPTAQPPTIIPQINVSVSINTQDNKMKLLFNEADEMRYHGVWLRHNCRCPLCYDHAAQNSLVRPNHLERNNTIIEKVDVNGDIVHVSFPNHTALFPVDWLKEHCYSNKDYLKRKHKEAEPLVANSLPVSDYTDIMTTQEGLYKWIKQLVYYGVSLIKNAPTDNNTIEKIANKIGFIQESAYGYTFEVLTKDNPDNLAYGCNNLIYHMDLLYHESPPALQILHCIRNDSCVEGGESTLIDAYPIIKQLQRDYPHYFNILSTVPVPHMKIDYVGDNKFDIRYAKPHIILDEYGEVSGIRWNPPGQYPIRIPEDSVEDYYNGFLQLSKMFDQSDLKIVHKLSPGDMLTFNNRRILHGRNAFVLNGGTRYLRGLYMSGDLVRSKFVVLSNDLGKDEPVKRVFIDL